MKSLSEQKEKLQEKLNSAEDLVEKHKASLTNLQIVLEQFQAGNLEGVPLFTRFSTDSPFSKFEARLP